MSIVSDARILVVDDEQSIIGCFIATVRGVGYRFEDEAV